MRNTRRYFLRQYSHDSYQHGGIGYADIEKILTQMGYEGIQLPAGKPGNPLAMFSRIAAIFSLVRAAQPGDEWVFIFPVYGRMNRWLLKRLINKVKVIGIVGDIDGLKDENPALLQRDIRFMKKVTHWVVHNIAMQDLLRARGVTSKMARLECFDYLAEPCFLNRHPGNTIVYAGNLSKSPFIGKPVPASLQALHFNVYGNADDVVKSNAANICWKGAFAPYRLPAQVQGSYGLVWDGEEWERPSGPLGRYMAYISHHKISLYLLCGLPVLVPRFAGSAAFIQENGLGIVFDNITDIPDILKTITAQQYNDMHKRAKEMAGHLLPGNRLQQALGHLSENR